MKKTYTIKIREGSGTYFARVVGENFQVSCTSGAPQAANHAAHKFAERFHPNAQLILSGLSFTIEEPDFKPALCPIEKLPFDVYALLRELARAQERGTLASITLSQSLHDIETCESRLRAFVQHEQLDCLFHGAKRIREHMNQSDAGAYWITVKRILDAAQEAVSAATRPV